MARNVTLTSLLAQVRARADLDSAIVTDTFIDDVTLTEFINQSLTELYDLLVAAYGEEYYMQKKDYTTVVGSATYNLPSLDNVPPDVAEFYKVQGLLAFVGGKPRPPLRRLAIQHLGDWYLRSPAVPEVYHVSASAILLLPTPDAAYTVTLFYTPACPRLVNPTDKFDGVNGWEEYAVVDAALKCKEKEDLVSPALLRRKEELKARIEGMAATRDVAAPATVVEVEQDWDL